jgi:hypothetical protein
MKVLPKSVEMRLSWSQHLIAARTLELSGREQTGTSLALMGMALLMLLQDLQHQMNDVDTQL